VTLIIFVVVYAIDGLNSYIHLIPGLSKYYLYPPSNLLRLFTGAGLGVGISTLLFTAFNDVVWAQRNLEKVLEGFKDLSYLLIIIVVVCFLVLLERMSVLYVLSLVSILGILLLLSLVYTIVVVMIFRLENSFDNYRQLVFPLMTGFTIAMIQILLISFLRYKLTGTWDGFSIG
jgi:hypothetical protein